MLQIEDCLPESVRPHYVHLRDQRFREATPNWLKKLAAIRKGPRKGQFLAESKLAEEIIELIAYSLLAAVLDAIALYEIPFDQTLCTCIEQGIREFLQEAERGVFQKLASVIGMPSGFLEEIAWAPDARHFAIYNKIQIDLETARIKSQQKAKIKTLGGNVMAISASRDVPHTAVVINVLIASPSDVGEEREVATKAVHAWNVAHYRETGIMLNPIRWETHAFPASGDRPQGLVNRQIVHEGDLLIGIFGNRLGTLTGEAPSGTIEEIEWFRKADKHVALYFSTADVPRSANRDQLKALEDYQRERQKDTLYFTFGSAGELHQRLTQHLPRLVSEVYEKLRASHELEGLEEELRSNQSHSRERLSELATQTTPSRQSRKQSYNVDVRDWIGEWTESERQFRKWEKSDVFAEVFDGEWTIRSDHDPIAREEVEAICELAGSKPRNSPGMALSPTTNSQARHWEQWLQFLKETEGLNRKVNGANDGGYIEHLARISAIACTKCAARAFGH